MQLVIIRHGETIWNEKGKVQGQTDIPLLPSGVEQAKALGVQIRDKLPDYKAIYSSQLQRAQKTAEAIKGDVSIPIIIDARLNSRNLGDFSGLTLKDIERNQPEIYKKWRSGDPTFRPPNGESTDEMILRTRDFLKDLQKNHVESDKLVIVTHRENLGGLIWLITGKMVNDLLNAVKNCTPYEVEFTKSQKV